MRKKKAKSIGKKRPSLTVAQIEIVGQFNDYSFENRKLNFEQTVRKMLGPNYFPRTAQGRQFKRECREIFDREREE